MNWIGQNYTWLFDGVLGAVILGVAVWFLARLLSPSKGQVADTTNNTSLRDTPIAGSPAAVLRDFHPDPAPENILDRINGALPSHRNAMADNFRGLPVRWQARLTRASAVEDSADTYDFTFKPDTQYSQLINCRANISANAQLKTSDRNDLWEVCGFIEHVAMTGSIIDLRDVQITYLGSSRDAASISTPKSKK